MVYLVAGAAIDIEADTHLLKAILDDRMVFVDHLLGRDAFFQGTDSYGHAVLIAAADELNIAFLGTEIAHIDIGRQVAARQVADVHGAIGIGQGGCN